MFWLACTYRSFNSSTCLPAYPPVQLAVLFAPTPCLHARLVAQLCAAFALLLCVLCRADLLDNYMCRRATIQAPARLAAKLKWMLERVRGLGLGRQVGTTRTDKGQIHGCTHHTHTTCALYCCQSVRDPCMTHDWLPVTCLLPPHCLPIAFRLPPLASLHLAIGCAMPLPQVLEVAVLPAYRGAPLQAFLQACEACTEGGTTKTHYAADSADCMPCASNTKAVRQALRGGVVLLL